MNDQPLFFAGTSHPELAREMSNLSGIPLGSISIEKFPDGELAVCILEEVSGRDVVVLQTLGHELHESLFELLLIVDALKREGPKKIKVVIPYMGYARQDHKTKKGQPIGAKLVADLLVASGVNEVVTLDLHSPQIEGFFNVPLLNLSSREVLSFKLREVKTDKMIVVGPDSGSIHLVRGLASDLKLDFAVVNKHRVTPQKVSIVKIIGDVKGKDVLLADDMCSTGETLVSAAKAIQEKGANRVIAAVTHGLFVEGALEKIGQSPIEEIWVSNTLPCSCSSPLLKVFSVAPLLSKAVFS